MRTTTIRLAVAGCMLLFPASARAQSDTVDREFPQGDFTVAISHDALTDANTSSAMTPAESGEGALGWKCLEDGLNVVLAIGRYYEGDDDNDIVVQYRFDDEDAQPQEYWPLFSSKEWAYIPMSKVAPFTASALESRRIVLRAVDPFDDETHTFVFKVDGLEKALRNLPCVD